MGGCACEGVAVCICVYECVWKCVNACERSQSLDGELLPQRGESHGPWVRATAQGLVGNCIWVVIRI